MILTGPKIREEIAEGRIFVDPYEPDNVNPNSIDLRLGDCVCTYDKWDREQVLDVRVAQHYRCDMRRIDPDAGIVIWPNKLYLLHTLERVCTSSYVPVIDGKSSVGRIGICVHITAGYGDIGFDGQWTLEVTSVHPVRLYPNMRICQMRFHEVTGPIENYQHKGNYGGTQRGPVPSRLHTQF